MDISKLDEMILDGSIEVAGVLNDGSFTYKFTDKLKENSPEIYKDILEFFYKQVAIFWEKGFINFDFSLENPLVTVTEKIYDKDALDSLTELERVNLSKIISLMIEQHK